jgi:arylsulfatase A-like enzyme
MFTRLLCLTLTILGLGLSLCLAAPRVAAAENATDKPARKPNVIVILADDLGYGELGCYGQQLIQTPHLDAMAKDGMRFTQFYAGSTVCAPSRSVLMTGQHTGRTWVRGNGKTDAQTLRESEITLATLLKSAGYATALCGKWGLGELGSTGHPNKQGFDYFYGYLNQHHAHNYYPPFLVRNSEIVPLRNVPADNPKANEPSGAGWAKEKRDYTHDLFMEEALTWVKKQQQNPFFLYLALTIPHANNEAKNGVGDGQEVPDYGIYADKPWTNQNKGQAAMISRMDKDIGRLIAQLKEQGVDNNTLIIFTSDNGPHKEGNNDPQFFNASGPLTGIKRSLTEGGIRVPTLMRWPGTIPANKISDHVGYAADILPTVCALAGIEQPKNIDGLSIAPTLTGQGTQAQHAYLYWEFYELSGRQAVRFGNYKAIREPLFTGSIKIYDLAQDIAEKNDLAEQRPELVEKAAAYMKEAHVPNPNWEVRKK